MGSGWARVGQVGARSGSCTAYNLRYGLHGGVKAVLLFACAVRVQYKSSRFQTWKRSLLPPCPSDIKSPDFQKGHPRFFGVRKLVVSTLAILRSLSLGCLVFTSCSADAVALSLMFFGLTILRSFPLCCFPVIVPFQSVP